MCSSRLSRSTLIRSASVFAVAAVIAMAIAPASASALFAPMSLEQLSRDAETVVVVQATGSQSRASRSSSGEVLDIVTEHRLVVTRVVAGSRPIAEELKLSVPGGVVGDIGLAVSGAPEFKAGERAVLFLDEDGHVVGGAQGKLSIDKGRVTARRITVEQLAREVLAYRTGTAGVSQLSIPESSSEVDAIVPAPAFADVAEALVTAAAATTGESSMLQIAPSSTGPSISSITPAKQPAGAGLTVAIEGSGFGTSPGSVTFPCGVTLPAARRDAPVVSWSNTRVVVTVPELSAAGEVRLVTAGGATAAAQYQTGFGLLGRKFAQPEISFYINENYSGMTGEGAEIIKAFDTWNAAGSRFRVTYAGPSTASSYPVVRNEQNDAYFAVLTGAFSNALAVNHSWYFASSGAIIESDIVFNSSRVWAAQSGSNVWDVQTVAVHEIGHSVGLADQYSNFDRAMGAAPWATNRRGLSEHEIAGAVHLHGAVSGPPSAPQVTSSTHPQQDAWYAQTQATMSFSADSASGISGYSWVIDGSPTTVPVTSANNVSGTVTAAVAQGERWFHVRAIAQDGQAGPASHYRLRSDTTAPVGSVQLGSVPGFATSLVTPKTASVTDALSGVAQMRVDGGAGFSAWTAFSSQSTVTLAGDDGLKTVRAHYRDHAGNVLEHSATVILDRIAPVTTAEVTHAQDGRAEVTLTATDQTAGVAETYIAVNGGPELRYTGPVTVSAVGDHTVTYRSVDRAGNAEQPATTAFRIALGDEVDITTDVVRAAGEDRYATAIEISRQAFPGWAGVKHVVIASGEDRAMADPLSASGLAGVYDAPILLVRGRLIGGRLPAATETAIEQIRAANGGSVSVHVVGGPAVVPADVYNRLSALKGRSGTITRTWGADRYATSVEVAKRMMQVAGPESIQGLFIANGQDQAAFFDSLAVSPIVYAGNRPLLLVRRDRVPDPVAALLADSRLRDKTRTLVNAAGLLNQAVYSAVGSTEPRMTRSTERKRAAVDIAERAVLAGWLPATSAGIANGLPDALTGGAALGRLGGPLLYTDPDPLFPGTREWLAANAVTVQRVLVIGGEVVVRSDTLNSVTASVNR